MLWTVKKLFSSRPKKSGEPCRWVRWVKIFVLLQQRCVPVICVWGRNERKENPGEWQSLYLWSSLLFFPSLITPSNPLFSCSTLRLSPCTPTKHFDSLSHPIHQSINLSITPSLLLFVWTQPYLPTTHALSLMHFVSPSCFFHAVQYRLFISVTSYSKVYTTSAPSCLYFGRSGQMSFLLMLTLSQLTKIVKTTREDWGPVPLCVRPWCQTSSGHFMLALILTVSQLSSALQCTGHRS